MAGLRYLILGPLEIRDDESEIALRGGHQRKLLVNLLLHAPEAVSSDRLIETLWDGRPPETAAKALQGYVSSLRKQLGPEAVETVGSGYRLIVASEDTDAGQFEELLAEARPLEPAAAVVKLRAALALWRGPALADFAYEDFARNEIDRLEELRLGGIERRIDLELALGHHDDLVPELEGLVRRYPLRERLRGFLMVALYRSGRQAEALDVYRDARSTLRNELGLEPSEELQSLQRSILDHDPALAAPPRVDPFGPAGAGSPRERRRLRRPWLAVALGLLLILGAAVAALELTTTGDVGAVVVPANSVVKIDPTGTKIETSVRVGRGPVAIAVGLRGVWVANSEDSTVTRLNPATGRLMDTIGAGTGDLSDIAVGFDSVWVANGNDGTITKIDPRSDSAGLPIKLGPETLAPDPVFYIAVDHDYVWATRGNELLRIDPTTGHVKRRSIGTPTGLTTGGGSVWLTTVGGKLWRVDPHTLKADTESLLALSSNAQSPVYGGRSLWLVAYPHIPQVDPNTLGSSLLALPPGLRPIAIAWGGGALWSMGGRGRVTRLPPSGRSATHVFIRGYLSAIASGGGATWVAVSGPN